MRQMIYRSEIQKFLDYYFGGVSKAAVVLNLGYNTVRRWNDNPRRMLMYSLEICSNCDATHADIVEAVEYQLRLNNETITQSE